MAEESRVFSVIAEKRPSTHPWGSHSWAVVELLEGVPATAPFTRLEEGVAAEKEEKATRYYIGAAHLVLFSSETSNYQDNLHLDSPKIWVVTQEDEAGKLVLVALTVDPAEGEAYTQSEANIVEVFSMRADIGGWMADFITRYHVDRPFYKRKRDGDEDKSRTRRGG